MTTASSHIDEERIVDLSDMLEAGLGRPVNRRIVERFAEKQAGFEARQTKLAEQAQANEISREAYVARLDQAMQELAADGESLLGFDDFHKAFGEFRVHNLFDTSAFIAEGHAAR